MSRLDRFLTNPPRRISASAVSARKAKGARPPMSRFAARLVRQQGGKCHYCRAAITVKIPRGQQRKATVDHLIPLSKGGTSGSSNLVAACLECNQRKADKMPDQFWREINASALEARRGETRAAGLDAKHDIAARSEAQGDAQ